MAVTVAAVVALRAVFRLFEMMAVTLGEVFEVICVSRVSGRGGEVGKG